MSALNKEIVKISHKIKREKVDNNGNLENILTPVKQDTGELGIKVENECRAVKIEGSNTTIKTEKFQPFDYSNLEDDSKFNVKIEKLTNENANIWPEGSVSATDIKSELNETIIPEEIEIKTENPTLDDYTQDSSNDLNSESEVIRTRNGKMCKSKTELFCPYCGLKMYTKPGLSWHLKIKHSSNVKLYECFHCGQKMVTKSWLMRHLNVQHNKNFQMFKCPQCPYENKWKTNIFRHIKMAHEADVKMFTCKYCGYTSKWQGTIRWHCIRKHWDIKEVADKYGDQVEKAIGKQRGIERSCEQCDYKTNNKSNLRKHIKYMHKIKDKRFKCSSCPFSTKYQRHLKFHNCGKRSNNPNLFNCTKCKFITPRKNLLNKHTLNKHTLQKCLHCDFTAEDKTVLNRHTRLTHGTENELECATCQYKTKYKTTLAKHIIESHYRNNSKKELVECGHCGFKSLTKMGLQTHIRCIHVRNVIAK